MPGGKETLRDLSGKDRVIEDLAAVLENAPIGIHFVDREGVILWANRTERELLGYEEHELVGRNIADFHIDTNVVKGILDELAAGGKVSGAVVALRHKDGSTRYGSVTTNACWENDEFVHSRCFTRDVTDAVLREQETAARLKQREDRATLLETIFDTLKDFAYAFDRKGRFLYANGSLLDLWGLSLEEAIGKDFFDLNYPKDLAQRLQDQIERVYQTGETVKDVTPYTSPSGRPGYYEYIFQPAKNADGEVKLVVGSTRDLTSHKDTEERLRETQRVLRLAMISSQMGAWARDIEKDKDYWTPELEALFGLEPGTFKGEGNGFFNHVFEEDRERTRDEISTALAEHREYICEFRFNHADGSIRWMEGRGQAIYNDEGQPIKLYGIGIDITERKKAEAALRESESNLRNLANSIPQLAWMSRPDGYIFWYNQRWFEYTGTTLEEMEGEGWMAVHDPVVLPDVIDRWTYSLQTGTKFEMEFPLRGADGEFRWFLTQVYPIRDTDGTITRWFGTNTDIQDLWDIRQKTEAASRAKDDFLAMLSHELRAPLNVMSGWSQILRRSEYDTEKVKKAIEIILRNVDLQSALIEDLLDVSRIVSGKIRLETSTLSFNSIVRSCIDSCIASAEAKGVTLRSNIDSDPAMMEGDEYRLMQIVNNLLSNAIKFTPSGGSITAALDTTGDTVKLVIADTGIGIPEKVLPHIFERFRQADTTSTRQFGGLGLGLAIVDHLVRLHGGKIQADSPGEGKGSTFTVELPLVSLFEADPGTPRRRRGSGDLTANKALEGLNILVVDDDPDALMLMTAFLESEGASVSRVGSASEALATIGYGQFDVLISDLGMPMMDGYEFMRLVRQKIDAEVLPAIALTGYVSDRDRDLVFDAGFQSHMPKPVELDDLRAIIQDLAKRLNGHGPK
jgi:PAS domain S-box-containing protein